MNKNTSIFDVKGTKKNINELKKGDHIIIIFHIKGIWLLASEFGVIYDSIQMKLYNKDRFDFKKISETCIIDDVELSSDDEDEQEEQQEKQEEQEEQQEKQEEQEEQEEQQQEKQEEQQQEKQQQEKQEEQPAPEQVPDIPFF